MNTYKFRAWDKNENKMFYFDLKQYMSYSEEWQERLCSCEAKNNLMQYIGKDDKNGKKIFEGDIVIAEWYSYIEPEKSITGEVIFNDGWLSFCIWNESEKIMSEMNGQGYYTWEVEVIGNIYENPELIERE